MATVLSIDTHFTVERMGEALAKLHFVDGLMLRLHPSVDEQAKCLSCPITMAPILRDAAMIEDGSVYQFAEIRQWLAENDRSPLTNLELLHRNILRVSSLTSVLENFLHVSHGRREQARTQHLRSFALTDRRSCKQLEDAVQEIDGYVAAANLELTNWQRHVVELEMVGAELRESLEELKECYKRRERAQDRETTRSNLCSIYQKVGKRNKEREDQHSATVQIQGVAHSFCARKLLKSIRAPAVAAVCIQKCARSFFCRHQLQVHKCALMLGNRRAKLDNMILQAAKQGTEQIVPALLDKRASPEAADHEGSTPLIHASRRGYQGIVQILLNRRASPDLANLSGDTPLHVAICAGHEQVVCLLSAYSSLDYVLHLITTQAAVP